MSAVTLKEIVEALRSADRQYSDSDLFNLAQKIEQHGIAPPDGMVLVKAKPVAWRHWDPIECDFEYHLKPVCNRCDALYIAAAPEVTS